MDIIVIITFDLKDERSQSDYDNFKAAVRGLPHIALRGQPIVRLPHNTLGFTSNAFGSPMEAVTHFTDEIERVAKSEHFRGRAFVAAFPAENGALAGIEYDIGTFTADRTQ